MLVDTSIERIVGNYGAWDTLTFGAAGQVLWDVHCPQWQEYGLIPDACLELGQSAVTRYLAATFGQVRCIGGVNNCAAINVITHHAVDQLPAGSLTAAYTTLVSDNVQLCPTRITRRLLASMARVLAPGATVCLHLPIRYHYSLWDKKSYRAGWLENQLTAVGFADVQIVPQGIGSGALVFARR